MTKFFSKMLIGDCSETRVEDDYLGQSSYPMEPMNDHSRWSTR